MTSFCMRMQKVNTQADKDEKRYIYSSDQNIVLDDNGLLITYEYFQETKLIPVQDLKDMPGGIILAEGGIGKTTFVKQLNVLLGEQSKMFELGLYSADPSSLKEEIDKFILNYTDNKTPVIIMDGLDEAPDLSGILIRILRIHNSDAVFWLTSRDIPEIRRIQDENRALNTYSLAPLSVDGIKNMAAENNIDQEYFVKTSYEKGVLRLCAKPIGCNFVINAYKNDRLKNSSYKDIWYKGILNLCDENDAANKARVEEPAFTIQDIFECSAWIALCLSLGGKSLLWVDEPSRCKESYISLDDMIVENIPLKLLRLTVKRGIFTPIGNGTVAVYACDLSGLSGGLWIEIIYKKGLLVTDYN